MLRKLVLERFKSFERAEMEFGPLTLIVGPNASGKSNIREALRFLHGVARGYTLADIIGEKWGAGGVLQWRGIRGGLREIAFGGAETFALEVEFDIDRNQQASYHIEMGVGGAAPGPRVAREQFRLFGKFDVFEGRARGPRYSPYLEIALGPPDQIVPLKLSSTRPALSQLPEYPDIVSAIPDIGATLALTARFAMHAFASMRFLDLNPDAMRLPSVPGQVVLGDRGENLSSVLQAICVDEGKKRGLLEWMRELTPMDVVDFEFPADQTGRVLVTLVEESGRRVSAYSASDGTLRFLAMVAALLGPEAARFYFIEELENGLHPTRLALLLQLIEQQTAKGEVQVVATTHSAELLGLLSPDARSHVVESYRLEDSESTGLTRVMDLPDAGRIVSEQGLARLHASGWIEDAVEFSAPGAGE